MLALPEGLLRSMGTGELQPQELAGLLSSSVGLSMFIVFRPPSPMVYTESSVGVVRDMNTLVLLVAHPWRANGQQMWPRLPAGVAQSFCSGSDGRIPENERVMW